MDLSISYIPGDLIIIIFCKGNVSSCVNQTALLNNTPFKIQHLKCEEDVACGNVKPFSMVCSVNTGKRTHVWHVILVGLFLELPSVASAATPFSFQRKTSMAFWDEVLSLLTLSNSCGFRTCNGLYLHLITWWSIALLPPSQDLLAD